MFMIGRVQRPLVPVIDRKIRKLNRIGCMVGDYCMVADGFPVDGGGPNHGRSPSIHQISRAQNLEKI